MALTTVIQKNVLYSDGQACGTIKVGTLDLQARLRVFPTKNNIVAIQTYFPLTLTPRRSDWATHHREWCASQGLAAADIAYISPKTMFDAVSWTEDERHLETATDATAPDLGNKVTANLKFKIKDDGTVETSTVQNNEVVQQQEAINQLAQQNKVLATQTETEKAANAQVWKVIKIVGGIAIAGVAIFFGAKAYKKYQAEKGKEDKKDKMKSEK